MKGKRGNLKSKIFSNIYKQIGIIAIAAFTIYIVIKTVQTQHRKKIEGFEIKKRDEAKANNPAKARATKTDAETSDTEVSSTEQPEGSDTPAQTTKTTKTTQSGEEKKQISITIN